MFRTSEVWNSGHDGVAQLFLVRAAQLVAVGEEEVDRDANQRVLGDPLTPRHAIAHERPGEVGQLGALVLAHPRLLPLETRELGAGLSGVGALPIQPRASREAGR